LYVQHFAGYIAHYKVETTPVFFDLNCKIAYNFKLNDNITLQLNAGLKNIFNSFQKDFDKGEFRDAGYLYGPTLPRTVFFGVKWSM
jgi:outer membrane receptor for ferrienterochelin and colicins